MILITKEILRRLRENGIRDRDNADFDPLPVVKIFTPDAQCVWLLTSTWPGDDDLAFGLCDLGMGSPELGCVTFGELYEVRGKLGLRVERDLYFVAKYPISKYAAIAAAAGRIVT